MNNGETATVGLSTGKIVVDNDHENIFAGNRSEVRCGAYCKVVIGNHAKVIGGQRCEIYGGQFTKATAQYESTVIVGHTGHATVTGFGGLAKSGYEGHSSVGPRGVAEVGDHGWARAGKNGEIRFSYMVYVAPYYRKRERTVIGYIGEAGLEPDTWYHLNKAHEFVRVGAVLAKDSNSLQETLQYMRQEYREKVGTVDKRVVEKIKNVCEKYDLKYTRYITTPEFSWCCFTQKNGDRLSHFKDSPVDKFPEEVVELYNLLQTTVSLRVMERLFYGLSLSEYEHVEKKAMRTPEKKKKQQKKNKKKQL